VLVFQRIAIIVMHSDNPRRTHVCTLGLHEAVLTLEHKDRIVVSRRSTLYRKVGRRHVLCIALFGVIFSSDSYFLEQSAAFETCLATDELSLDFK